MREISEVFRDVERTNEEGKSLEIEAERLLDLIVDLQEEQDNIRTGMHEINAISNKLDQVFTVLRHVALSGGYMARKEGGGYVLTTPKNGGRGNG